MIDFLLLNIDVLLLLAFGLGAVAGALLMIVLRQPMRVAMALIFTMLCLGAVYGLLGVHFIAAFQVLIYVGAVMVFMVFAIMLLEPRTSSSAVWSRRWGLGAGAFVLLLAVLVGAVWTRLPPASGDAGAGAFGVARFARSFLSEYWLHFELSSVLLVVAVVAALAVIRVGQRGESRSRHG